VQQGHVSASRLPSTLSLLTGRRGHPVPPIHCARPRHARPAAVAWQRRRPRPPAGGRCQPPRPFFAAPGPPLSLPCSAPHVARLPAPHPFKKVLPPSAGFFSPAPCFLLLSDAAPAVPSLTSTSSYRTAPRTPPPRWSHPQMERHRAGRSPPPHSRPTTSVSSASALLTRRICRMAVVL
jgi:hypothetical protein